MATKNRTDYKTDFARNNYDRISLQIPKGYKEKLQFEATLKGFKSLNAFIINAIEKQYDLDLSKKPTENKLGRFLLAIFPFKIVNRVLFEIIRFRKFHVNMFL